ncbi:hypothetical protein PENTCL1PPCAC_14621, partial [Pristionchus entomophagus]
VPHAMLSRELFDNNCLLYRLQEWISGFFHNTLPSLLLLVSTIMLTVELNRFSVLDLEKQNKKILRNNDAEKASRILLVLAILTLLSELPQGIISLGNALFSVGFQYEYTFYLNPLWMTVQIMATSCNLFITLGM